MSTLRHRIRRAISTALLVLAAAAPGAALAQSRPLISMDEARRVALAHVPGSTVESIELDVEQGREVYEVELRAENGVEHDVIIDAHDGRVIRSAIDD